MDSRDEKRSDRKHREIMRAATAVFVAQGYDGTSMDEIASKAGVSKQTIYKHFSDKDNLFTEIILATTRQVDRCRAAGDRYDWRQSRFEPRPANAWPQLS